MQALIKGAAHCRARGRGDLRPDHSRARRGQDLLNIEVSQYSTARPTSAPAFRVIALRGLRRDRGLEPCGELRRSSGAARPAGLTRSRASPKGRGRMELARVARLEAERYEQLNGVLPSTCRRRCSRSTATTLVIIASQPADTAAAGPCARARLLGRSLKVMQPEAVAAGPARPRPGGARARVQRFAQRDWVVNRTPIREHGEIVGAALTALRRARRSRKPTPACACSTRRRQARRGIILTSLVGHSPAFARAADRAALRAQRPHGADRWRERRGQGAVRAVDPQREHPRGQALRGGELRGLSRGAARERAVRRL